MIVRFCCLAALLWPTGLLAVELPADIRLAVESFWAAQFVRPETSRFVYDKMTDSAGGRLLVCGKVDYQNSIGKYQGPHLFYVFLRDKKVVQGDIWLDGLGPTEKGLDRKLKLLCGE